MSPRHDCCPAAELELVRRVWDLPGPVREVKRCHNCGAFWRFDAEERMNFSGGEDHYFERYTKLTPAEAAELQ
jgi:hypothetical protein